MLARCFVASTATNERRRIDRFFWGLNPRKRLSRGLFSRLRARAQQVAASSAFLVVGRSPLLLRLCSRSWQSWRAKKFPLPPNRHSPFPLLHPLRRPPAHRPRPPFQRCRSRCRAISLNIIATAVQRRPLPAPHRRRRHMPLSPRPQRKHFLSRHRKLSPPLLPLPLLLLLCR